MEPGAERDRLELDLQVGRGSACAVAYRYPANESEKAWLRAINLLRNHPDDPRYFWARRGLSTVYSARADLVAYAALAQETMERAKQSGDPAGLCVAHVMFANLCVYTGKFASAEQEILEAARHVRADSRHESSRLSGADITVQVPVGRMHALSFRGDRAGAEWSMKEGLRLAEEQPQVGVLIWALFWASFRCLIERDLERAGALAGRAMAVASEQGFGFWATAGQASQGAALVIADPSRAAALIGDALAKLQGLLTWHPHFLCFEAEALLGLGRIVEARGACDRALALSASTGVTWWDAELHRIRAAVIRAENGGEPAVREELASAVAIAEQQGSETFRRRAAADLSATHAVVKRLSRNDSSDGSPELLPLPRAC